MSESSTADIRGPWDAVVVGHGFSSLTAAKAHLEAAAADGRSARVAVFERAPFEQRGGSTRRTTAVLSLTPELDVLGRPGLRSMTFGRWAGVTSSREIASTVVSV